MPEWKSGFIEANGIRMHYTRTGGDRLPLVLAHGYSDDGLCWTPLARELEAEFEVVMLDARYHGRSEAPEQDCNPSVMAADLAGAIRALGLRAPMVLGHSMGAMSALALVGQYPEVAGAMALEDPPAVWAVDRDPPSDQGWLARNRAWIAGLQRQTWEAILADKHAETPGWSMDELGPWADSKLRFNPGYFDHLNRPKLDWPEMMRRIRAPVLLITGEPGLGAMVTAEQAAALQAAVPGTGVAHIAGAGHNIRRDQFQAYLAAVRPVLAAWSQKA
jgi:N-formylmaleamate deformylase